MNDITADYTLDCRGLSCPMPLLKTYKTLATMTSGEILELWGTDPGTKNDMEWLHDMGCRCFSNVKENENQNFRYLNHKQLAARLRVAVKFDKA